MSYCLAGSRGGTYIRLVCSLSPLPPQLHGGAARSLARELISKTCFVVRVDLGIVSATRHSNVRQTPIDEFFARTFSVHVHQHAVGGLSLAAVAGDRVAVVNVPILSDVECDGPA